jgi:hypothetical protein
VLDSGEPVYATRLNCGRPVSRVAARRRFDVTKPQIPPANPYEDFEETRERLRQAEAVSGFEKL